MTITGSCLCGAVRYESRHPPLTARACWCRLCQKIGAGGPTVNAVFPSEGFAIAGTLTGYSSVADSGNVLHRRFCPVCGTHLFSEAEVRPHLIVVRAGTLDDPEIARPQIAIWTGQAPSWACFDPEIPRDERQPQLK